MDTPIFGGGNSPQSSATNFNYIHATANWDSNGALRESTIPFDLTITSLTVTLQTAPGAGTSRTFTIQKNGSDTELALTIADANVTGSSITAVSFSKGDTIRLKATPTNTPASAANTFWSVMAVAGTKQAVLMSASVGQPSTSTVVYAPPTGSGHQWDATYALGSGVVPSTGSIRGLYITLSAAPGAGRTRTFTYYLNGSPTSLICTASGASDTFCEDQVNSFSVVPGDTIGLSQTTSGTQAAAARVTWGAQFVPTVDGESFVAYVTSTTLPTSGTNFSFPNGAGAGTTYTTEPSRRTSSQVAVFSSLYAILGTAPGSGKSYAFTVRNGGADSALTLTVADTNATGADTANSFTPSFGALLSMKVVASGTPTSSIVRFGYKMYVAPTATTQNRRLLLGVGQ